MCKLTPNDVRGFQIYVRGQIETLEGEIGILAKRMQTGSNKKKRMDAYFSSQPKQKELNQWIAVTKEEWLDPDNLGKAKPGPAYKQWWEEREKRKSYYASGAYWKNVRK
ncbi:MAG: hypothetical protein F6K53_20265 [Moorea sp. SIO4A1]|uniref:hypothetical protein n=1 Tax=Moorena sp. SIO4A1 TaxID=2607835 RepID=UPI00144CA061|nr:hypothetical protein [Moorena sp. SIO4A1]NEQ59607.1 hypothetical protein [Moorena sp. SIO4A1]